MSSSLYLVHHGIKGMKWGVRRFQNSDGTLTEAGKQRYRQFDAEKDKVKGFATVSQQKAKDVALEAKRLNSAYYDDNNEEAVVRSLEALYGSSKGIGDFYRNSSELNKSRIVGEAYNDARITAAQYAANAAGYRATVDAMNKAGDVEVFRIKNDKGFNEYYKTGMSVASKEFNRLSRMTATELMIDLGMDNEHTQRYKELFPSASKASNAAIAKHIKYDAKGRITSISPELEKAIGTSLSDVDDPELLELVAQQLESK